jgi:nucleotide-binding universal stress UspA family protein
MIRLERILCPTDFSKYSFRAADYAVALARHDDSEVHFLHVIPSTVIPMEQFPYAAEAIPLTPEFRKRAVERLDAFVALSRSEGVRTRFTVAEGAPVTAILNSAEADRTGLICLGTHGREGVERLILGSVAERVLRKARSPVLTVSEPGDERAPKNAAFKHILCAVDFSSCSLAGLRYAIRFGEKFAAKITVLHVLDLGYSHPVDIHAERDLTRFARAIIKDGKEEMRKFIRPVKSGRVRFNTELVIGTPVEQISDFALAKDFDLIITSTHGLTGFKHVLIGSIAEHLVRQSRVPLLVVPSHPEVRAGNVRGGRPRSRMREII